MDKQVEKCRKLAGDVVKQMKTSPVTQKALDSPKLILYGALFVALASWLLVRAIQYLKQPSYSSRPSTPTIEKAARSFKAPERKPGGSCNPPT